MLFFQFPLTSHKTHTQDVPFHHTVYDYFHANLDGFCDHLRDNLREDIFKQGASTAAAGASDCCEWVQVGMICISLITSISSSLTHLHGFQLLVLVPSCQVHRNHFLIVPTY